MQNYIDKLTEHYVLEAIDKSCNQSEVFTVLALDQSNSQRQVLVRSIIFSNSVLIENK